MNIKIRFSNSIEEKQNFIIWKVIFFTHFTRRLNSIFAGLCQWKKSIILRTSVLFEARTVVWKTVGIGHFRKEILLRETRNLIFKFFYSILLNWNLYIIISSSSLLFETYAICNFPFGPIGMLFKCWTQRSTATGSPICTIAVPSLVFKNLIRATLPIH